MPDLLGRFVRCQVGGPSSTWLPILGERSTRISYERQPVDCTTRTEVWQTRIGGGVGSRSITVSGVARKGAGWSVIMQSQWSGSSVPLRFLDVADAVYEGSGLVSKLTQEMAHDGAQLYSVEFVLGPAIYDGYITSTYTSTWTGSVWGTPVLTTTTVVTTLPVGVNTWTAVGPDATGTFTVAVGVGDFNGWVIGWPPNPVPPLPNNLPPVVAPPASSTEEWAIQAHIDYGLNNPGPYPLSGQIYAMSDLAEKATLAGWNNSCGSIYIQYSVGSLGGTPIGGGASYFVNFKRGLAVTNAALGSMEAVSLRLGHGTGPGYSSWAGVTHTANLSLWKRLSGGDPWVMIGAEIQKAGLGSGANWVSGYPADPCPGYDWGANSNWATAAIPGGGLS